MNFFANLLTGDSSKPNPSHTYVQSNPNHKDNPVLVFDPNHTQQRLYTAEETENADVDEILFDCFSPTVDEIKVIGGFDIEEIKTEGSVVNLQKNVVCIMLKNDYMRSLYDFVVIKDVLDLRKCFVEQISSPKTFVLIHKVLFEQLWSHLERRKQKMLSDGNDADDERENDDEGGGGGEEDDKHVGLEADKKNQEKSPNTSNEIKENVGAGTDDTKIQIDETLD